MLPPTQARIENSPACDPRPIGPITRRLVYALVLIPIVPAIATLAADRCDTYLPRAPFDGLRWFHLFVSSAWVVAAICIWRAVILWTLGRKWLTALISLIPFVQVVCALPLWSTKGCLSEISDGALRVGQQQVAVGLWIWITVWVWWGWEKRCMATKISNKNVPGKRMTPTAKRLAASIGSIPFVGGVFAIIAVALDDLGGLPDPMTETFACTAVVAVAVWILIWRRVVLWSSTAIRSTVVSTLVFLATPIAIQALLYDGAASFSDMVLTLVPVIGWGLWMGVTVSIWPRRAYDVQVGGVVPRCLKCGYLLIGLRATRCPECGDEPTLDELWHAAAGEGL